MSTIPHTVTLNTGERLPVLGFGTGELVGDVAKMAVAAAVAGGYRLIDTASMYQNEAEVGEAVRQSTVPREDLYITTKLWTSDHGYESALAAFDTSLQRLGLEYVDLYLIHWPGPFQTDDAPTNQRFRRDTWRAFEEIYQSGRAKAIGVSNFTEKHLEKLLRHAYVPPAVNQIELHPFIYESQKPILDFCQRRGVIIEAYSPLTRGDRVGSKAISAIAEQLGRTSAQVLIRWSMQHGAVPLPRSANPRHIEQNAEVFDFELSVENMQALDALSDETRFIENPYDIS